MGLFYFTKFLDKVYYSIQILLWNVFQCFSSITSKTFKNEKFTVHHIFRRNIFWQVSAVHRKMLWRLLHLRKIFLKIFLMFLWFKGYSLSSCVSMRSWFLTSVSSRIDDLSTFPVFNSNWWLVSRYMRNT